jgi:hypothetical protein
VIKANGHAISDTANINGHVMVILHVDAQNCERRPHDDRYRHAIETEAGAARQADMLTRKYIEPLGFLAVVVEGTSMRRG